MPCLSFHISQVALVFIALPDPLFFGSEEIFAFVSMAFNFYLSSFQLFLSGNFPRYLLTVSLQ